MNEENTPTQTETQTPVTQTKRQRPVTLVRKYRFLKSGEMTREGDWCNAKSNNPNLSEIQPNEHMSTGGWIPAYSGHTVDVEYDFSVYARFVDCVPATK